MRRFTFRLARVLRHREQEEGHLKDSLLSKRALLSQAESEKEELENRLLEESQGGLPYEIIRLYHDGLRNKSSNLDAVIEERSNEVEVALLEYQEAFKSSEMLRKVKSSHHEVYRKEEDSRLNEEILEASFLRAEHQKKGLENNKD